MRHTRCAKKEQQICSSALYRMARRSSSFFFGTSCCTRTSVRIECEAVYRSTHQSNVIFFAYDPATLQPFALRQGAHDLRHQHTSRSSMDIGYTSSNNFALYNASTSSLYDRCSLIFSLESFNDEEENYHVVEDFVRTDTLPELPNLQKEIDAGCSFCAEMKRRITMHVWPSDPRDITIGPATLLHESFWNQT